MALITAVAEGSVGFPLFSSFSGTILEKSFLANEKRNEATRRLLAIAFFLCRFYICSSGSNLARSESFKKGTLKGSKSAKVTLAGQPGWKEAQL